MGFGSGGGGGACDIVVVRFSGSMQEAVMYSWRGFV